MKGPMTTRSAALTPLALALLLTNLAGGCAAPPDASAPIEELRAPLVIGGTSFGPGDPGGTYYKGVLYLSYTGTDNSINIMRRVNGSWFKQTLTEKSNDGSSLLTFNGFLYLAWVGTDSRLNYMRSNDGVSWFDKVTNSNGGMRNSPGIAGPFNGALHLVTNFDNNSASRGIVHWTITTDHVLHLNEFFDQANEPYSHSSPSAAVLGNQFVMVWEGVNGDRMYTKKWDPTFGWLATTSVSHIMVQNVISGNTSPPSLILVGRIDANIGSRQITFERSTDGISWSSLGTIGDTTSARPQAVNAGPGFVEFAWAGTDGGHSLNLKTFNF
jgi:hypothetical protein